MIDINSLVAVLVLYKCNIEESSTINSLNKSLEHLNKRLNLLVWDNGPIKQYPDNDFLHGNFTISYKHDPKNPGISEAYNKGILFARSHGAKWILLLDQDTTIGTGFVDSYIQAVSKNLGSDIVCIIPKVISSDNKTMLSPAKFFVGGIVRPAKEIKPGIINSRSVTGLNSGTIISPEFIESLGGFSNNYPLDMLDHWYFREIRRRKKKVLLLDTVIQHNLSVKTFFKDVSLERYNKILLSENVLLRENCLDLIAYKFRLAQRLFKQLKGRHKDYANLTTKYLFR